MSHHNRAQLKLMEGMTPAEIRQLKQMEDRLRRERSECDKLRHTIDAIMGDKVDSAPRVYKSPKRTSPSSSKSGRAAGPSILSPRYRPQSAAARRSGKKSSAKKGKKSKVVFTNFARAPRFEWQKYEKPQSDIAVDITHLSKYRDPVPGPSPCSYSIPTAFSPYTNEGKKKAAAAKKGNATSDGKKLDFSGEQKTQDGDAQVQQLNQALKEKESRLERSQAELEDLRGKLLNLTEISSALQDDLHRDKQQDAESRAMELNLQLSSLASPEKQAPPEAAAAPQEDEAMENDDVRQFVESSVVGSSFKIWEKSPQKWTDQDGYERTGHWVTVRTRSKKTKKSKRQTYLQNVQGKSYEVRSLEKLFDTIDVNEDGKISGKELQDFMSEQMDTPAGRAMTKHLQRAWPTHKHGPLFAKFEQNYDDDDEVHENPWISKSEFVKTLMQTEEKRELGELFDKIDADKDGVITGAEMHQYLERTADTEEGLQMQKYVFQGRRMYLASERMYEDDDGKLGHEERSSVFRALDLNDDGFITKHEFVHGLEAGVHHIHAEERGSKQILLTSNQDKLKEIFRFYCNFGERFQEAMSVSNWTKMLRECDLKRPKRKKDMLLNGRNLTLADLGIIFNQAARYQATHTRRGTQEWEDLVRSNQKKTAKVAPRKKARINFRTMLYGLRLITRKRYPKEDEPVAMKKLLTEHVLPLYDDDIAHAHSAFTKMQVEFTKNLKEYESGFLQCEEEGEDGETKQVGAQVFFDMHKAGLSSIFLRYASMDAATGDNEDPELQYIAHSSWADVQATNKTMDWLEFSTFMQDFAVVPKLASRLFVQRIFNNFSTQAFAWHDKNGKVVKQGESHVEALDYEGFLKSLGLLAMVLFKKDEISKQCPTPKSKLELLFFKMARPLWLLKGVERRMTNSIDIAVRTNIMKDMNQKTRKTFMKPKEEVDEVEGILRDLDRDEDNADA